MTFIYTNLEVSLKMYLQTRSGLSRSRVSEVIILQTYRCHRT